MSPPEVGPRVLIVEDDPAVRELLLVTLTSGGFRTSAVSDLMHAVALAQHSRPDVITLDCTRTGLCLDEALMALECDPSTRQIPVVVISALGDLRPTESRGRAAAVFRKPFDINEVIVTVERITRHREIRAAL